MTNPLRRPLVLFAILVGLALFVHRYPPRSGPPERKHVAEIADDSLRLRKTSELHLTADVRSRLAPPTPLAQSDHILPIVPDEAPRTQPTTLPRLSSKLSPLPSSPELPSVLAQPTTREPSADDVASRSVLKPLTPLDELTLSRFHARHSGAASVQMHRIVDGDTLKDLAARYLGDENRYLEIFEANRDLLRQPDLLPLGSKLRIPHR